MYIHTIIYMDIDIYTTSTSTVTEILQASKDVSWVGPELSPRPELVGME
jgi:hypothetical protein